MTTMPRPGASLSRAGRGCARAASDARLAFFLLVLALALPFWVIGGRTGLMLLPGLP